MTNLLGVNRGRWKFKRLLNEPLVRAFVVVPNQLISTYALLDKSVLSITHKSRLEINKLYVSVSEHDN